MKLVFACSRTLPEFVWASQKNLISPKCQTPRGFVILPKYKAGGGGRGLFVKSQCCPSWKERGPAVLVEGTSGCLIFFGHAPRLFNFQLPPASSAPPSPPLLFLLFLCFKSYYLFWYYRYCHCHILLLLLSLSLFFASSLF